MKLYTCESGKELFEKNETFGAWDETERKDYEPYAKSVYSFEVNEEDIANGTGDYDYFDDYNYYINSSANIIFTKVK